MYRRKITFYLFIGVLIFSFSCKKEVVTSEEKSALISENVELARDLSQIKEDGKLTVITIYNSTSYFLYRGKPMGFEYELVKKLAEHLKLELDIKVANDIDHLFDMLNRGDGDLVAFGLSVTEDRKKQMVEGDQVAVALVALDADLEVRAVVDAFKVETANQIPVN